MFWKRLGEIRDVGIYQSESIQMLKMGYHSWVVTVRSDITNYQSSQFRAEKRKIR